MKKKTIEKMCLEIVNRKDYDQCLDRISQMDEEMKPLVSIAERFVSKAEKEAALTAVEMVRKQLLSLADDLSDDESFALEQVIRKLKRAKKGKLN